MDWTQVLAIVVPIFFAIIIGIFYQNKRFEDINRRFEDMNKRFEDVNRRFEDINRRFEDVNKRIDDIREEIKELKTDLREIKTLIIILIQKEAGVKVKEEAEKLISNEK